MSIKGVLALAFFLSLLGSSSVLACPTFKPLDPELIRQADLVIMGTVKDYSPPTFQADTQMGRTYGRFQVEVLEVLHGQAPQSFKAIWANFMFGYPRSLSTEPLLMAFAKSGSLYADVDPAFVEHSDADSLVVLQDFCSKPFILAPTAPEVDQIRELIKSMR